MSLAYQEIHGAVELLGLLLNCCLKRCWCRQDHRYHRNIQGIEVVSRALFRLMKRMLLLLQSHRIPTTLDLLALEGASISMVWEKEHVSSWLGRQRRNAMSEEHCPAREESIAGFFDIIYDHQNSSLTMAILSTMMPSLGRCESRIVTIKMPLYFGMKIRFLWSWNSFL